MKQTQELKIHELKIFEHFATDIITGRKTFEIRNNDRQFEEGDLVHFQAVSEENAQPVSHPINGLTFRIGYILRAEDFPGGIKDGFAIFTIERVMKQKKTEEAKRMIEIKDDDLPITAAQKIICGTRKITVTPLMQVTAQALTGEPHDGTCDMFSLEDLEEIAEYLMVYCRKHKNGD